MKLHLGCGKRPLPGFINVDFLPGKGVNQTWDLCDLPYPWEDVDEIVLSHTIEHLERAPGVACLRECQRLLNPGGLLWVVFPDLKKIVEIYAKDEGNSLYMDDRWLINAIFETQEIPSLFHRYGYTEMTMRQLLESMNFQAIETLTPGPYLFGGSEAFEIRPAVSGFKVYA